MTPIFVNLKFHRLRKNRTQSQLAKALGIDPSIYSRIEKGERKLTAEEAKAAARYLRISATTLFRDGGRNGDGGGGGHAQEQAA